MVRIMARVSARAGNEMKLRALLQDLLQPSRDEAGCMSYELFHNEDDPLEFVIVERWADQAAVDLHLASAHIVKAIALASDLLAQPPLIHRFKQVG